MAGEAVSVVPPATHYVSAMIDLERATETALVAQEDTVKAHPAAAEMVKRLAALAGRHRGALEMHIRELSAQIEADSVAEPASSRQGSRLTESGRGELHAISSALCDDYVAAQRAALGYQRLWVACSRLGDRAGFRLAAEHQRAHAAAALELVPLLSEVLVWELGEAGQDCACVCPACGAMGVCLCSQASALLHERAIRDAVPTEAPGVPVQFLRVGGPAARAGAHTGDRIVAANGEDVTDPWNLLPKIADFKAAGTPVPLRLARPNGELADVTVEP